MVFMNKKCNKCQEYKDIKSFRIINIKYTSNMCSDCTYKYHKEWRRQNPEKTKQYQESHAIDIQIWRNSERGKEYRKNYWANPDFKKRRNIKRKERFDSDILYKLQHNLRSRMHGALKCKNNKKFLKSFQLIGCSAEELKKHLESKFLDGMNWGNYGFGDDKWHIDHIIPCDSFDLSKESEQKKCFHWTNLQPLWQPLNLSKSNKII